MGLLFALLLGIFLSACTKEESFNQSVSETQEEILNLKNGVIESMSCDLIAGQDLNLGKVIVWHDDAQIHVTYTTTAEGWYLSELHLYVGDGEFLPKNKSGAPVIGKFPFSVTGLTGTTTYTFDIDLPTPKPEEGYLIAAHAVVVNGEMNETAWSNCNFDSNKLLITLKSVFVSPQDEHWWAASDGEFLFADKEWIGPWLGINNYENPDEYMLQSWMFPVSAGGAGKVDINENSGNIEVTVTPKEGLTLEKTYLYIGTMEGLLGLVGEGTYGCPNYYEFPYQNSDNTPTHKFSIPMPTSSFQNSIAFSGSRWGWYSYYNY
jgi:hypothetical protein